MTYVTKQLDGEVGIQYRGVEDKTNLQQPGGTGNLLMIVEGIPRGRIDQAMTINAANLAANLGREKGNLFLQAVQDALNTGVPSVQVLRISNDQNIPITYGILQEQSNFFIESEDGGILQDEGSLNG